MEQTDFGYKAGHNTLIVIGISPGGQKGINRLMLDAFSGCI